MLSVTILLDYKTSNFSDELNMNIFFVIMITVINGVYLPILRQGVCYQ